MDESTIACIGIVLGLAAGYFLWTRLPDPPKQPPERPDPPAERESPWKDTF